MFSSLSSKLSRVQFANADNWMRETERILVIELQFSLSTHDQDPGNGQPLSSAHSLLFIQSRLQDQGMVPHMPPTLLNYLNEITPQRNV